MGLTYVCDLFHDDQPAPVKVKTGRLISMPYSLEMNDVIVFERELRDAAALRRDASGASSIGCTPKARSRGTVMCIPLHPYLIGQPYRIKAFEEALAYITRHDKVWLATGREIAKHFVDHHSDAFARASVPVGEAP